MSLFLIVTRLLFVSFFVYLFLSISFLVVLITSDQENPACLTFTLRDLDGFLFYFSNTRNSASFIA